MSEAKSMLDLMDESMIFSIKPMDDGTFEVIEMCDEAFGQFLTREQLLQLADEIRDLAGEDFDHG